MILLFGGTTEGRATAHLLDHLGMPYLYHTRTPGNQSVKGKHQWGLLDQPAMVKLCRQENISLLIDAGHPFAEQLHKNVTDTAEITGLTAIRIERPELSLEQRHLRVFESWPQMMDALEKLPIQRILALTGVQTIGHFQTLKNPHKIHFRILDSALSFQKGLQTGVPKAHLHPAPAHLNAQNLNQMLKYIDPTLLISKESGTSGYLQLKIDTAAYNNLPLWIIKRPKLPRYAHLVYQISELHQLLLRMRRTKRQPGLPLRNGYTTGVCATAAALGAFEWLMTNQCPAQTKLFLPDGAEVEQKIYAEAAPLNSTASCTVIKDAGDDPDVTHAAVIGCRVKLLSSSEIRFERGEGVGLVTLPGLNCPPGEPAINEGPKKMMVHNLKILAQRYGYKGGWILCPFIPEGRTLAQRTFNPRIGITGGLSIIGTTGIVRPYSHSAFVGALQRHMEVAKAMGYRQLVATAGQRGENLYREIFGDQTETAFVHYGNLIGETIHCAIKCNFEKISIGILPGKAIKLARGAFDTHSKNATLDPAYVQELAQRAKLSLRGRNALKKIILFNEAESLLAPSDLQRLYHEVEHACQETLNKKFPKTIKIKVMLLHCPEHTTRQKNSPFRAT